MAAVLSGEVDVSGAKVFMKPSKVKATDAGQATAVAYWLEVDLVPAKGRAAKVSFSTAGEPRGGGPASRAGGARPAYRPCLVVMEQATRVRRGDTLTLRPHHDGARVGFAVAGTAPPAPRAFTAGGAQRWHWNMLADSVRNDAFAGAVADAVERAGDGCVVLDIGAGSGLLSMVAARAGAAAVVACEVSPPIAEAAKRCVRANGYHTAVTVVPQHSSKLQVARKGAKATGFDALSLPRKADVCVFEVFGSGLLEEGVLRSVYDAKKRLCTPGATMVPRGATLVAVPIEWRSGLKPKDAKHGVDGTALGGVYTAENGSENVYLEDHDWRALAAPLEAFEFDFKNTTEPPRQVDKVLEFRVPETGVCNAVAVYFELELDERRHLSTGPDARRTHWPQQVFVLKAEAAVKKGGTLPVRLRHDGFNIVEIAITGTNDLALQEASGVIKGSHRWILDRKKATKRMAELSEQVSGLGRKWPKDRPLGPLLTRSMGIVQKLAAEDSIDPQCASDIQLVLPITLCP